MRLAADVEKLDEALRLLRAACDPDDRLCGLSRGLKLGVEPYLRAKVLPLIEAVHGDLRRTLRR